MPWRSKSAASKRPANNLLERISRDDFQLIAPHLVDTELVADQILYNSGDMVGTVYFPCMASSASFAVAFEEGREVQTVLIGREGAVGGVINRSQLPAYVRLEVRSGGMFARLPVNSLEAAKARSSSLRTLFDRYADCFVAQLLQGMACNAVHSIEQRAAKLIVGRMEASADRVVPLTHEQLASFLGVGRSYASRVLHDFRRQGIVDTGRGAIIVNDAAALRRKACRCDTWVKKHFEDVLDLDV
jgi:hypothetical protein